jgi:DNA-binding MarR family transcriptional regulator
MLTVNNKTYFCFGKLLNMNRDLCEALPFGRSLAVVAKSYFSALTKRLEHLEIGRYYSILILIENTEKACTQQYISNMLKMDKVSMVRIIDYLVNKDYVKKVLNPNDRREYFVELTQKAINVIPEIHTCIEEVNHAALHGISKMEQIELYKNISSIQKNLEALPSQKICINYKKASKKHEA